MDLQGLKDLLAIYEDALPSREEINPQVLPHLEALYQEARKKRILSQSDLEEILRYIRGEASQSLCLLAFVTPALYVSQSELTPEIRDTMVKSSSLWNRFIERLI